MCVEPSSALRLVARPSGDRHIREGDIIVTAVAGHYAVGRMTADGRTQDALGSQHTRATALRWAGALAGTMHRVFLYGSAGSNAYLLCNGTDTSG